MAITLNGANQWTSAKNLILFGERRSVGTDKTLSTRLERIRDAISSTAPEVEKYTGEHPEFAPICAA
jgi:hypothetical protein